MHIFILVYTSLNSNCIQTNDYIFIEEYINNNLDIKLLILYIRNVRDIYVFNHNIIRGDNIEYLNKHTRNTKLIINMN